MNNIVWFMAPQPPIPSSPPLSPMESMGMGTPSPPFFLNSTTITPPALAPAGETPTDLQQPPPSVAGCTHIASLVAATTGRFLSDPLDRSTHIASSNIGLLTPPSNTDTANPPQLMAVTAATTEVVHDIYNCMFKIALDTKGTTAALCYLPTRFQNMIEFYHTEIPVRYRDLGLGELLVVQGFHWAEVSRLLVIPTCPFVCRYLDRNQDRWDCVVPSESNGLSHLIARAK